MLQQSEYNARDYLAWFGRTHNFKLVARRKQLDMTQAAKGFLVFLTVEAALGITVVLWLLLAALTNGGIGLLVWLGLAIILFLLAPYLLAYSLLVPLLAARVLIQKPHERAQINRAHHRLAAHPAIKIAIAGSYGKTTMKELLATVLSQGKVTSATPGNMNTPIGISRFVNTLRGDEEVLIFEMGEYYPGDIARLCELAQPDVGIITGVNEAHLSKFKSLDATVATIFELGDNLNGKPLYVNGESELAAKRAPSYPAQTYNRQGVGEWQVSKPQTGLDGTTFTLTRGKLSLEVNSGLLGVHQLGPLSVVAVIADDLGLEKSQIENGMALTRPFEHRLQPTSDTAGVTTIDDAYNGNPDGARVAIEFLSNLKAHKRFYVTPGLTETAHRTRDVHETIGRQLAESGIEVVVLIETSAMPYMKAGLVSGGFKGQLMTYPDEISALMALPKFTTEGDVVLLQNDWGDQYI